MHVIDRYLFTQPFPTLANAWVKLEAIHPDHATGLFAAGNFPEMWRYLRFRIASLDDARFVINDAIQLRDETRSQFAFMILKQNPREASTYNQIIGSSSYLDISRDHCSVEIGNTYMTPEAQGCGYNIAAKRLLLEFAFDTLKLRRVFFKTHSQNETSRAALLKLGTTFEGILRNHMILPDGSSRDSAYYSILPDEWPAVRETIDARLALKQTQLSKPKRD